MIRKAFMLLPGDGPEYQGGGLAVATELADLLSQIIHTEVIYYQQDICIINNIETDQKEIEGDYLYIITWGPHIERLIKILKGKKIVYYAQSVGWNINLPNNVPVFCVSKYVMSFWAQKNPFNPLYLVSPVLNIALDSNVEKDIDVIFIERKSSRYLKNHLIPRLERQCRVKIIRDFIKKDELISYFRRSKVYIYSSRENKHAGYQWIEGFGLQPLEALLCGCVVFSNLHGGLSDHMDPGINMNKIETYSIDYDEIRILNAVHKFRPCNSSYLQQVAEYYSEKSLTNRLTIYLTELSSYFEITRRTPFADDIFHQDNQLTMRRARMIDHAKRIVRSWVK